MNGPFPESLCVQSTSLAHRETATPLLSGISFDDILPTTRGASKFVFSACTLAGFSVLPPEPHAAMSNENMTKNGILAIVFFDIFPYPVSYPMGRMALL